MGNSVLPKASWVLMVWLAAAVSSAVSSAKQPAVPAVSYKKELRGQLDGIGESFSLMVAMNAVAEEAGLTSDEVRAAVRRALKDGGIQINDGAKMPMVTLSISATKIAADKKGAIYSGLVELHTKEPVLTVNRKESGQVIASVWSRSLAGVFVKGEKTPITWAQTLVKVLANDFKQANR